MLASKVIPPPRILLAVDGSPPSAAAESLLTHITWPAGTSARVLSIVPEHLPHMGTDPGSRDHLDEMLEIKRWRDWAMAKIIVREVTDKLRAHHLIVDTEICEGHPPDIILGRAIDFSVDLIVVGAKGSHASPEFRLGSTASKVAHCARASVLVVRPTALIRPLPTVIVVDDPPTAWPAIEFLCNLSLPDWAAVTVANVVEKEVSIPAYAGSRAQIPQPADQGTPEVVDHLYRHGVRVRWFLRFGCPAEEILAIAEERQATLIVIGAKGRSRADQTRLGDIAQKVVNDAPCSVLTVR
jgi:nucleotide-binding universal stress UspA family protein